MPRAADGLRHEDDRAAVRLDGEGVDRQRARWLDLDGGALEERNDRAAVRRGLDGIPRREEVAVRRGGDISGYVTDAHVAAQDRDGRRRAEGLARATRAADHVERDRDAERERDRADRYTQSPRAPHAAPPHVGVPASRPRCTDLGVTEAGALALGCRPHKAVSSR